MQINEGGKQYIVSVKENGDKFWYLNNQLHRELGPAIELHNGSKAWYLKGIKYPNEAIHKQNVEIQKTASAQQYFDVKVECLVPAVVTFRVLAKSAEEAATLTKGKTPTNIQHKWHGRKDLIISVYDAGSNMMRFIKRLVS